MKDEYKTKKQLIRELGDLRKQIKMLDLKNIYLTIFENTGTATVIIEEDTTISLANKEFERLSGYSKEEIEGKKSWTEFVVKDDLEIMKKYHHMRRSDPESAPHNYEFRFIDRKGDVKNILLNIDMIPGTNKSIASLLDITEYKNSEKKIKHLNLVLRAIKNVNQLITIEKNKDRLLKRACELLIETGGYYSAWIALFDRSRKLLTTAEAGLGKKFQKIVKLLESGKLPNCIQKSLLQTEIVITKAPHSECTDCPLSKTYHNWTAMTVQLKYLGKLYGFLRISTPEEYAREKEGQDLLKEVAGDIAFALHDIKLGEEKKRLEKRVREARVYAESIIDTVRNPLLVLDADLKVMSANRSFYKTFKVNPEETEGQFIYELGNRQWDIPKLRQLLENILPQNTSFEDFEVEHNFPKIGYRVMLLNARRIHQEKNKIDKILLAIEDITERKKAELEIKKRIKELEDFYDMSIGRELRMIELKKEIEALKEEVARYKKIQAK